MEMQRKLLHYSNRLEFCLWAKSEMSCVPNFTVELLRRMRKMLQQLSREPRTKLPGASTICRALIKFNFPPHIP